MAGKNSGDNRTRTSVSIFIVAGLCCFFYLLGAWQRSGFGKGDSIAVAVTKTAGENCDILPNLNFETRHAGEAGGTDESEEVEELKPCDPQYTDYTPCQDQKRAMTFPRENMNYRERHCPPQEEKLHCLIPAPKGYVTPFPWPKSRDYVPYANAPYKSLTVEKAIQNWVQYEGNMFRFPGGGTQFPQGADKYIDQLASVVPIENGTVRTALDTGCGVASWGAYLWKRNVIAMSFAPRDSHEAQVQFALERGVPAVIGVLGTIKMPYPSKAFDMAHCSRCLIPWGAAGMYLMLISRKMLTEFLDLEATGCFLDLLSTGRSILRPGNAPRRILRKNKGRLKRLLNFFAGRRYLRRERLLFGRKERIVPHAVLHKKIQQPDSIVCVGGSQIFSWENEKHVKKVQYVNLNCLGGRKFTKYAGQSICHNLIRYNKMEMCITPNNGNGGDESLKPFPERLYAVPPRIANGLVSGVSVAKYQEDSKKWKKHISAYKKINKLLDTGRYRNIMDMNAGLGGFAAALHSPKFWVMNVMPTIAEKNTLGVIFERGLIGIYHDWNSVCVYSCHAISVCLCLHRSFSFFNIFIIAFYSCISFRPILKNDFLETKGLSKTIFLPHKGFTTPHTPLVGLWDHMIETLLSPGSKCFVYMLELRSRLPPKCEAFSTYPRTYDLIHASGLFSLYKDKCEFEDILLEMDRILRPEGAVILRDNVDVLIKVKKIIGGMRWNFKLMDHEDGPLVPEKILVAVKQYWTLGDTNSTSSQ
uniref:Putative methyltransferase family protein n=1 Tax=Solanum demissum TaxID=50514 RepID=Q6L446_SOLDE|nr:Putative methyltransferase family protein [Solanum demissum]